MNRLSLRPRSRAGLLRRAALPLAGLLPVAVVLVVLGGAGAAPTSAMAADSEPNEELGPGLRSLIAKEKIRQRTGPRGSEPRNFRGGVNRDDECGTVDIGNSSEVRGRSARERVNPREQTVIVTGPVVNAARCR